MNSITIQGKKRNPLNKKQLNALRLSGEVPCVIYNAETHILFTTSVKNFKYIVYTPEVSKVLIQLDEGEEFDTVLKEVQFSPVEDDILHADFYKLDPTKKVEIQVPVKFHGRSIGASKGGILSTPLRKIKVKALPDQLPDHIEIDITSLDIGSRTVIKDIRTEKYELLHPDNTVVVAVNASRASLKGSQKEGKKADK